MTQPASAVPPARTPDLPRGLAELAAGYDVLLCDLWGVVHNGRHAFRPALDALRRFRALGGTVILITNAPRPRGPVLEQMASLGITREAFDGIVTSGDVTISAIVERGEAPVHHIGPPRDLALFEAVRDISGRMPPLATVEGAAYVMVSGLFDDAVETPADYAVALARMRERGLPMICANPDIVVHVGDKLIYCGGALAEAYAALGGKITQAGKPHPPIYRAALGQAAEQRGATVDRARVLAIGDGMKTDVAGAAAQGIDMLFITSGIHRNELHPEGDAVMDRLAYAERLSGVGHPLRAAMPHLVW